jgi:hypothetical protein
MEIIVNQKSYYRLPIKTHLIEFGENLTGLVKKYISPCFQEGDWLAVSEKVVSVCQNRSRHISTVQAGKLAKIITRFVKKYPKDIGYSRPEKMQVAIEEAGYLRIILAMLLGGFAKLLGIRGIFWRIAGNRVSEIDGFVPYAMSPYDEYAMLPPDNPQKVCQEIEDTLNIPCVIIDGNNINVKIISQSQKVPLCKKLTRKILLDNPMGQDKKMTPFILVRESNF